MGPPKLPARGTTNRDAGTRPSERELLLAEEARITRVDLIERTFASERTRIAAACDAALAALPLPFIAAGSAGEEIQELRAHIEGSQIARRATWLSDDLADDFRWFSLWRDTTPGFDPCVFAFGGASGEAFGVLLQPDLARAEVPAPVVYASGESDPPLLWVAADLTRFEIMIEAGTRSAARAAAGTIHPAVAKLLEGTSEERRIVRRWYQEQTLDDRKTLAAFYAKGAAAFASASLVAQGTVLDADAHARARREELRRTLLG